MVLFMTTIQLQSKISEDGILQLVISPEFKGLNVNITVTVDPIKESNQEKNKLE